MNKEQDPNVHSIKELNELYREADECDREIFAEMRTNLLLVAGDHYTKRQTAALVRTREFQDLNEAGKLRLTKNHVQNICKIYANHITASAPGVGFRPKNEKELADQKSAEIHQSVWLDAKDRFDFDEKVDEWGDDLSILGEVGCKVFYDPREGEVLGYEPAVDEQGQPVLGEDGQPKRGRPIYEGAIILEPIYGFNLLRDPSTTDMKKSPYYIVKKLIPVKKLHAQYPQHKGKIGPTHDKNMLVFDIQKGQYRKSENEALVKEFYFRKCEKYPQGYFFYTVEDVILEEGELPGGVFPIVWQFMDKSQTSPRGYAPVRHMRPYQIEINRAASKMAEHQVSLGDDKVLVQNGTSIAATAALPGVRALSYNGAAPTILPGRDGSQYLAYMNAQIDELYRVMNVPDEEESSQLDPYVLLFRAAKQKKKFKRYIGRMERFLRNITKTYVKVAKIHMPEQMLIKVVGRPEYVNIPEFKNAEDSCYEVRVEAQTEDVETKFGTQIFINQVLQYIGNKLEKKDIGQIIKAAPFSNFGQAFADLTLDYDSATNLILALDRGEEPLLSESDPAEYMIQRLVSRMRQADFRTLDPQVQQRYQAVRQFYINLGAEQLEKIERLKQGFIPTDGYMVTCDFYVSDPKDPMKTKRVKLPYSSVAWLIKQLEVQGKGLEVLEQQDQQVQAEIADRMSQGGGAIASASGTPPLGQF